MNAIVTVDFYNDTLYAIQRDDGVFVAVKPICDRLGVNWANQLLRIKEDPVLSEGIVLVTIPSPGGAQETTCLKLEMVNGWLFKIDPRRAKDEETRQKLLTYQRECYRVLFEHFHGGRRAGGAVALRDIERERHDIGLVQEARMTHGKAFARQLWFDCGLPGRPDLSLGLCEPALLSGEAALARLMGHMLGGQTVREAVEDAAAGRPAAVATLDRFGIQPGLGGIFVANEAPAIGALFPGVRWVEALRRLPGARAADRRSFAGIGQSRTTWLPLSAID